MPELPEVETTVRGLNQKVLNRTFIDVWSGANSIIKKPKNFKELIKGKKIIRAWRRAKNVIIDLSEGYSLLIHQKMTGHLLYGKWNRIGEDWQAPQGSLSDPYNRFLRIIFFLDNGYMLALSDLRKFAKVELWKKEDLLDFFKSLGPEPLDKDFTKEKFISILKAKKGRIKQVLMDQAVLAGVGNIYSDEALWRAKIHPLRRDLSEKELSNLCSALKEVLEKGIELGGESFSDYRNIDGKKGRFDLERKAYRREGEKCSRCQTIIKRIKIGQRSSCFCPYCQKI